jgi:hypothetical protein
MVMSRLNSFRKKGNRKPLAPTASSVEKVEAGDAGPEVLLVTAPEGMEKMSTVIRDFVEPFIGVAQNEDEYRNLLVFGCVAWNIALAPEMERPDHVEKLLQTFPKANRESCEEVARLLIERKLELYGDNTRSITSYQFSGSGETLEFTVTSTMPRGFGLL